MMGLTALRRHWRERQGLADQAPLPEDSSKATETPLPEDFPARAKLEAAGITTLEAVRANLGNLRKLGLTKREAEQVGAAI
jgi:hypothetical protein